MNESEKLESTEESGDGYEGRKVGDEDVIGSR